MEEHNADEFGKYSSFSNLAVCALVLALLSPLAFISPLLLVLPVAAVACAAMALGKIHASSGSLTGSRLAYAAIAIGIVSAVASVVRLEVRDYLYVNQADRVAREWLGLMVADHAIDSIDVLSGTAKNRLFPPPQPGEPPQPFDPEAAADRLSSESLATYFNEHRDFGDFHFELVESNADTSMRNPHAILNYRVKQAKHDPVMLRVVLVRAEGPGMPAAWLVESWDLDGHSAAGHGHHQGHHH